MRRKCFTDLEPNWTEVQLGENHAVYQCKNLQAAQKLRRMFEQKLADWTDSLRFREIQLKYPGGSLTISASMAANSAYSSAPKVDNFVTPWSVLSGADRSAGNIAVINDNLIKQVFNNPQIPVTIAMHKVMERLIESERPMFLICNETDDQVWLNQLACDMIQSAGDVAVRRCVRDYWEAGSLKNLHTKLRDTSQPFDHPYKAILNDEQPDVWFDAVSRYEPVEIDSRSFRLSTNQFFNIIGKADLQTAR